MKIKTEIIDAKYSIEDISFEEMSKIKESLRTMVYFYQHKAYFADSRNPIVEAPAWLLEMIEKVSKIVED